jgi:hypothetical protein
MALAAYKCPHCGAKLRPSATDLQVTCEYCGTTSAIQRKTGLFRAAPKPRDDSQLVAQAWAGSANVILFASIFGVAMTAFMLFGAPCGQEQTSGVKSSTVRSVASDYTRGATYVEGEAVKLWYGSSWHDATIKEVRSGGRYLVSYDRRDDHWDEVVSVKRLQKIDPPAVAEPAEDDASRAHEDEDAEAHEVEYAEGEGVFVLWRQSWYAGTIKEVRGDGTYFIGYDGYSSSWDEEVDTSRLRKRR